jgi:cellulose synthase (UDP-forming)
MFLINIISLLAIIFITLHTIYNVAIIEDKSNYTYILFVVISSAMWAVSIMFYILTLCWNKTKKTRTLDELMEIFDLPDCLLPNYDILIPCYKEDATLIKFTIKNILNLDYPKNLLNVYILDDSKRDEIKEIVNNFKLEEIEKNSNLTIEYVTRNNNYHGKAGNLNTFLLKQKKRSKLLTIFDCDMIPTKDFLQIMIPTICSINSECIKVKDDIALVQSPQEFYNYEHINCSNWIYNLDRLDLKNSIFYKLMLPAMSNLNCASYVGTNAIINRDALERVGYFYQGHATEDTITSLMLNSTSYNDREIKLYKTKYIYPKNDNQNTLAYGFAPQTLAEIFDQRLRWVVGSIQLIMNQNPFLCRMNLNFLQRLSYFQSNSYWFFGFVFLLQIVNHIIWLANICIDPNSVNENILDLATYQFSYFSHFIFFLLLPGVSFGSKLSALVMFVTYTPVYIYGFFAYMLPNYFKISSSSNKSHQNWWNNLFWFHLIVLLCVNSLSSYALFFNNLKDWQTSTISMLIIFYTLGFSPVLFGIVGGYFCGNRKVKNERCKLDLSDIDL